MAWKASEDALRDYKTLYAISQLRQHVFESTSMPNIVRKPRQRRVLRASERNRDPTRQPGTRLTHQQRCRIFTLSELSRWTAEAIAVAMQLPRTTVQSVLASGVEAPQKQVGRKPAITDEIRKRLIARATIDAAHRRMTYKEIARLEGVQAGQRALRTAFKKESYGRRVATAKPLLTEAQKQARLAWAVEHVDWKPEQWAQVVWTDECTLTTEGFGRVYVTRQPGEKYDASCCIPKLRTYSSWTIHGSISALGKGPIVVMEKSWGGLTGKVYREKVLPWVYSFMDWVKHHPENGIRRAVLMEDGASPHTAKLTKELHDRCNINKMCWPANSPDLNPIENVWRLLKQRVAKRSPRSLVELRQCIEKEWMIANAHDVTKYIGNMSERCKAVIDAKGGQTKW